MTHPSTDAKLEAVIKGARTILAHQSFGTCARAIFDLCREMTGAVSGYVALLREDLQENEVLFLEAGGLPCSVDPRLPMPIRGLRATAYESRRAVYENDFTNSPWVHYLPAGHVALRNVLFAPLNIECRTVGIIGLANKPADFTDEDAEIATVFGELAAIALMNSRAIELLKERTDALERALAEVKVLRGLLPICAGCKKIRNDEGLWVRVDAYLAEHTDAQFTHGLCPDCVRRLYPDDADRSDGSKCAGRFSKTARPLTRTVQPAAVANSRRRCARRCRRPPSAVDRIRSARKPRRAPHASALWLPGSVVMNATHADHPPRLRRMSRPNHAPCTRPLPPGRLQRCLVVEGEPVLAPIRQEPSRQGPNHGAQWDSLARIETEWADEPAAGFRFDVCAYRWSTSSR